MDPFLSWVISPRFFSESPVKNKYFELEAVIAGNWYFKRRENAICYFFRIDEGRAIKKENSKLIKFFFLESPKFSWRQLPPVWSRGAVDMKMGFKMVVTLSLVFLFLLIGSPGIIEAASGDFHFNLCSQELSELLSSLDQPLFYVDKVGGINGEMALKLLNEAGMEQAFALSLAYILGQPELEVEEEYQAVKRENNFLALEVARHPERLIGFFSLNPLRPYALLEISRCVNLLNLPGLKLDFYSSGVDLRNEVHRSQVKKVFRHAAELNLPILLNFRGRSDDFGRKDAEILLDEIIAPLPDLKLQVAHLGGGGGFDSGTQEVLQAFTEAFSLNPGLNRDRIVLDLSLVLVGEEQARDGGLSPTTPRDHGKILGMARSWGLDRVVFGSSWPYSSPEDYRQQMEEKLPLARGELETIMNNDPIPLLFESSGGPARVPCSKILALILESGVDYGVPFSVTY